MIAMLLALLAVVNGSYAPTVYTCSGAGPYTVQWAYTQPSDVVVNTLNGTGTVLGTLVRNTDYTLSLTSTQTTATITLLNPATTCLSPVVSLRLARSVPFTQPQAFNNQTIFEPFIHESVADRIVMQIQQLVLGSGAAVFADSPLAGNGTGGSHLTLDLTLPYAWTGAHTFSGTSTKLAGTLCVDGSLSDNCQFLGGNAGAVFTINGEGHVFSLGNNLLGLGGALKFEAGGTDNLGGLSELIIKGFSVPGSSGFNPGPALLVTGGTGDGSGTGGAVGVQATGGSGLVNGVAGGNGGFFTGGGTGATGVLAIGSNADTLSQGGDGVHGQGGAATNARIAGSGVSGTGGSATGSQTPGVGGTFTGGSGGTTGGAGIVVNSGGASAPAISAQTASVSNAGYVLQLVQQGTVASHIHTNPLASRPGSLANGDVWWTTARLETQVGGTVYVVAPLKAGKCTIGTNCSGITLPTTPMSCNCTDTTAAGVCNVNDTTGTTSLTITGTSTHVVMYTCMIQQ